MSINRCIACVALAAFIGAASCERTNEPAPDNTARNKGDGSAGAKTPMDQSESPADIKITADIRRAIMGDKDMSINAQNCKIITDRGVVTLRGPVATQAEKDAIEEKAKTVSGVARVINELQIAPK